MKQVLYLQATMAGYKHNIQGQPDNLFFDREYKDNYFFSTNGINTADAKMTHTYFIGTSSIGQPQCPNNVGQVSPDRQGCACIVGCRGASLIEKLISMFQ